MPRKEPRKSKAKPKIDGILGVGLDATDGEKRITRTEEMVLVGGSKDTHEQMQETAIRFGESLEKRGKSLQETTVQEAMDLLREAFEKSR